MKIPFNLDNFKNYYHENDIIKEKNFEDLKKYHFLIDDPIDEIAIAYYTYDSTSNINSSLRTRSLLLQPNEINNAMDIGTRELESYILALDKLTNNYELIENTILYRGLRENLKIEKIIKSGCFNEKGFWPSSFDKSIAIKHSYTIRNNIKSKGWIIQIYAPKGSPGVFLQQHSIISSEMEFLMPMDLTFHLFDIDHEKKEVKAIDKKYL